MHLSEIKGSSVTAKIWSPVNEVESGVLDQVRNVSSLPWVRYVSIMPDCHVGVGACIGSVVGMQGALSPELVGVDIGCGMCALKTNLRASDLPKDLKNIRHQIERDVPVGFNQHKEVDEWTKGYYALWSEFNGISSEVQKKFDKSQLQIGTLGGGNHFIEICLDKEQNVWIMLHSGSRNIGKEIAELHIKKSQKYRGISVLLKDTLEYQSYWRDLQWAQQYAFINRSDMIRRIIKGLTNKLLPGLKVENEINCHHNYAVNQIIDDEEIVITRKGAISAVKNQLGIIPGSMGAKSFIVRGLGNKESLYSASHGAGRKMSRSQAKRTFTVDDLKKQTEGVECRKDSGVIDELPSAYKDIEKVMEYQKDLVSIVTELKQILCIKG